MRHQVIPQVVQEAALETLVDLEAPEAQVVSQSLEQSLSLRQASHRATPRAVLGMAPGVALEMAPEVLEAQAISRSPEQSP